MKIIIKIISLLLLKFAFLSISAQIIKPEIELLEAIKKNDLDAVKIILMDNPNMNIVYPFSNTTPFFESLKNLEKFYLSPLQRLIFGVIGITSISGLSMLFNMIAKWLKEDLNSSKPAVSCGLLLFLFFLKLAAYINEKSSDALEIVKAILSKDDLIPDEDSIKLVNANFAFLADLLNKGKEFESE